MMNTTKRRTYKNNPGREALGWEIRLSWDDPWSSALSNAFGLCEVLTALQVPELIPGALGYSPSIAGPCLEDYPAAEFVDMFTRGEYTVEDAAYWLRVLNAYLDMVPEDERY